jgi:hypothetical protein
MFEAGPAGVGLIPVWSHEGDEGVAAVGDEIAVGDFNGDGIDDVVLGSELSGSWSGVLRAFFGAPTDRDLDGAKADVDCNDEDPTVFPSAPEVDGDGIDQSCDGRDASLGIADLAPGDVRITEVMRDPTADAGQWFELVVTAPAAVDLVGLTIVTEETATVEGFLVVTPNERVVVAFEADPALNGGVVPRFTDPKVSVSGRIALESADGLLEEIAVDVLPAAAGTSAGLDGETWCLATSTYGAGDRGTPGAPNDGCVAEETPPDTTPTGEDPTPTASGCGCDHGGSPAGLALLLLMTVVRRRP